MKIRETFIKEILKEDYPSDYQSIYNSSYLIQYLDIKSKAIHGDSKTRKSLANIYAVYSILHFYCEDFFEQPKKYQKFDGYEYTKLFVFYRRLYGGSKLQNHALNSRLNGEFVNKFKKDNVDNPIIINDGKYLIHPKYIIINNKDTAKTICKIVEKYVSLLYEKDHALTMVLEKIGSYTVLKDKEAKTTPCLRKTKYIWLKNKGSLTEKQEEKLVSLSRMHLKTERAYAMRRAQLLKSFTSGCRTPALPR